MFNDVAEKNGTGNFILNNGRKTIENILSMLFRNIFSNQNGITNLWIEIYFNYDNDDSELTII